MTCAKAVAYCVLAKYPYNAGVAAKRHFAAIQLNYFTLVIMDFGREGIGLCHGVPADGEINCRKLRRQSAAETR
jgi:hypothetical protein